MLKLGAYKRSLNCYMINSIKTVTNQCNRKDGNSHFNNNIISQSTKNISRRQKQQFLNEFSAVLSLFSRSYGIPKTILARAFHTTCVHMKEPSKPPRDRESREPNRDDPNRDNKNNKDDDKEKMMSVVSKTLLWMFTIYIMVVFISVIFTGRSRAPPPDSATSHSRYVSWNEFVHHMLAAGEVKELIVRPDMDKVTIILHDGAIVKGRRSLTSIYYMEVPEADRFEEKLRDVEKRLGIHDGVAVTYERETDLIGRILFSLVATGVIIALLTRMRGMKGPFNMDMFVSIYFFL